MCVCLSVWMNKITETYYCTELKQVFHCRFNSETFQPKNDWTMESSGFDSGLMWICDIHWKPKLSSLLLSHQSACLCIYLFIFHSVHFWIISCSCTLEFWCHRIVRLDCTVHLNFEKISLQLYMQFHKYLAGQTSIVALLLPLSMPYLTCLCIHLEPVSYVHPLFKNTAKYIKKMAKCICLFP